MLVRPVYSTGKHCGSQHWDFSPVKGIWKSVGNICITTWFYCYNFLGLFKFGRAFRSGTSMKLLFSFPRGHVLWSHCSEAALRNGSRLVCSSNDGRATACVNDLRLALYAERDWAVCALCNRRPTCAVNKMCSLDRYDDAFSLWVRNYSTCDAKSGLSSLFPKEWDEKILQFPYHSTSSWKYHFHLVFPQIYLTKWNKGMEG